MGSLRFLLLMLTAVICACSTQGDDDAKKVGLIVDSDSFAFPTGSLKALASGNAGFRVDSSVTLNQNMGLDSIVPKRVAQPTIVLIADGAVRICIERKALSRFDCIKQSNFSYDKNDDNISFEIHTPASSLLMKIVSAKTPITTGVAGDAYIPDHAIEMTAISPTDQTYSVGISRLTYVSHDELRSLNLQDIDGSKVELD